MSINLGQSKVARFVPGSHGSENHQNRRVSAIKNQDLIKGFCQQHDLTLKIHNMGAHYAITWAKYAGDVPVKKRVDWWPETANLVEDGDFSRSITCHGVDNLFKYFEKKGVV